MRTSIRPSPGLLVFLIVAGSLAAAVSSAPAAEDEIILRLAPGPLRLALPSPDGSRLAVIGGPGRPDADHTVLVLERPCDRDTVRTVTVSTGARIPATPDEVPLDYLLLQWSPDGTKLFAAGSVYELRDEDGALLSKRLRAVPKPVFDFRFGPGKEAAGVAAVEARRRKVQADREAFVVTLEYAVYPLDRSLVLPIPPREKLGGFWVPEDWDQFPAVEWEADGGLLLFYPYRKITERYMRGKARDEVADRRPSPRAEPGTGPFRFEEPCRIEWKLVSDKKSDRVKVKTK